MTQSHVSLQLTSRSHFDVNGIREGSISHRCERQHTNGVRLGRHEAVDGRNHAVLNIVDLPVAHWLRRIHGVIHSIAFDQTVGLLRLVPAHHHCVLGYDARLDVPRRAGGGLLSSSSFHLVAGRTLADGVDGRNADLVLSVGVEATDAVAGGGDGVHRLVLAVWGFGAVLDDVIGNGVRVTRVPGDGDAGGGRLRDDGGTRSSG